MYHWCFLCAADQNVDVDIKSLDSALKEDIGQFSLINFTLQGVPSSICTSCHQFLKEYASRRERYSQAEKMYLEILRMRNKKFDVEEIRMKYKIVDKIAAFEISPIETQQFYEVVENVESEDVSELLQISTFSELSEKTHRQEASKNHFKTPDTPRNLNKLQETPLILYNVLENPMKVTDSLKVERLQKPILLNPTIIVKNSVHNRIELFRCDLCSHSTSTKTAMERHMHQIHLKKSPNSGFTCKVCSKTFAKSAVLRAHEKIHLICRTSFDCPHCAKTLSSQTAVANHIKWMHAEKEFQCKVCEKKFATKGSMNEHEKIHSDVKSHVCPICQKSFKTASTLTQHVDIHGKTEYHCHVCNLRLNSKRTLRQHMLKHSNLTSFTCDVCKAQFKRAKAFKEHLISQHTNIKAYKCSWCEKTFANGANFRKHQKEHHPKELEEAEKKNIKQTVRLPKIEELLSLSLEHAKEK